MTKITNDAIKSFLLAGDVIDRTPTVSAADPSACRKNDLRQLYFRSGGGVGGGGVGVPGNYKCGCAARFSES